MSILKMVKQVEIRDSIVEGLIIITYPATGNSTYYVRASTKSRRRIKLGTSSDLTLKQARKKAAEVQSAEYSLSSFTLSQLF